MREDRFQKCALCVRLPPLSSYILTFGYELFKYFDCTVGLYRVLQWDIPMSRNSMKFQELTCCWRGLWRVHCQPRISELRDSILKVEYFFRLKSNENRFYRIIDPLVYFWPSASRHIILHWLGTTPWGWGGGVVLRTSSDGEVRRIFWGVEIRSFGIFGWEKFAVCNKD